jgi:DNA-binding response OmpR family regulator
MRALIAEALRPLELEVLQAENGQKGLQVVSETSPDLILLDLTMPVMDGVTMLRELRARGIKTPVIIITASSGKAVISRLLTLDLNDYIVKPFSSEELQAKVKKFLVSPPPAHLASTPAAAESQKAGSPTPTTLAEKN